MVLSHMPHRSIANTGLAIKTLSSTVMGLEAISQNAAAWDRLQREVEILDIFEVRAASTNLPL